MNNIVKIVLTADEFKNTSSAEICNIINQDSNYAIEHNKQGNRQIVEYNFISKKIMKQKSVGDCLTLIYNNQANESALKEKNKEDLTEFILEIFNKGVLRNYLKL